MVSLLLRNVFWRNNGVIITSRIHWDGDHTCSLCPATHACRYTICIRRHVQKQSMTEPVPPLMFASLQIQETFSLS